MASRGVGSMDAEAPIKIFAYLVSVIQNSFFLGFFNFCF